MKFGPQSKEEAAIFALEELRADVQYEILKGMKRLGLNQTELAKKLGKSSAWVSQLLGDDANLTLETISKVYLALGIRCHVAGLPAEASYRDALWEPIQLKEWTLEAFEIGRLQAADFSSLTIQRSYARWGEASQRGNDNHRAARRTHRFEAA